MLTLVTSLDVVPTGYAAGDTVDVFWNVDHRGNVPLGSMASWGESAWGVGAIAGGEIDETVSVNDVPIPLFPDAGEPMSWGESSWSGVAWCTAIEPGPSWGVSTWLEDAWGAGVDFSSLRFETPAVHFGLVRIAGKARDPFGNYQETHFITKWGVTSWGESLWCDEEVTEYLVNTTPLPPSRFGRSAYSGGQQSFTLAESPQLKRG